jgi:predicted DNA-binding transcriptional regulator YafY
MGMPKYDRLLYILNMLRSRRNLNAASLAAECGVTERSIYRDIISLSEANVPIYYDNGYKLATDNFLPPLNFTFEEYSCLRLAIDSCPLAGTAKYKQTLKRIKAKVEAGLSPQVRDRRRTSVDTTHIDIAAAQDLKRGEKFYALIEEAITENRCLKVSYESIDSGLSERVVEPYFIIFRRRAFYFVGYCRLRGDFRTFRIDRMIDVRAVDEHFMRRPDVNPRDYFEKSWEVFSGEPVNVAVRFTGRAARVISSGTHHPQESIEMVHPDEVLYRVTVSGLDEIQRWILGFGSEAVVVEPEELRESIGRIADGLQKIYGGTGKPG